MPLISSSFSSFISTLPASAGASRPWRVFLCASAVALASGCAGRPEAPILERFFGNEAVETNARLDALLPADVLLIGEQHEATAHQQIEQQVISVLAGRGLLAALALEMADAGASTAQLKPSSSEEQTRRALKWDDKSWPWSRYEAAVMTAVRAGVPVLGANLPRSQMPHSMDDRGLDAHLPELALKAQQQAIRSGHCNLLPEEQISPMTRIQIAKDIVMAETIHQLVFPGKVVVLLAGKGHVDRKLGVPQHLSSTLTAKVIGLQAGAENAALAETFDSVWITPALPEKDHCAELKAQLLKSGK